MHLLGRLERNVTVCVSARLPSEGMLNSGLEGKYRVLKQRRQNGEATEIASEGVLVQWQGVVVLGLRSVVRHIALYA